MTEAIPFEVHEAPVLANIEAEQAILSAILLDNRALVESCDGLEGDHFYELVHARIYESCRRLIERGQVASPVTLRTMWEGDEALADIGGSHYLDRLMAGAVQVGEQFITTCASTIIDLSTRRTLIQVCRDTIGAAQHEQLEVSAADLLAETQDKFDKMAPDNEEGGPHDFGTVIAGALHHAEVAAAAGGALTGVTWGLGLVNHITSGLHPGELTVLAGRPAMGKSAMAASVALAAATEHKTVAFFSLEMTSRDLGQRALSAKSAGKNFGLDTIPYENMRRGDISEAGLDRLRVAASEIFSLPVHMVDAGDLTVAQIKSKARMIKHKHGLDLIIVDYLQIVRAGRKYSGNKVAETTEVSQGLKALAKSLNVPVLALSQLSRQVENREDKRPMLSDLRESGAIEQDADVVVFLYRGEYYLQQKKATTKEDKYFELLADVKDKAEVIVAKNRHGATRTVEVGCDLSTSRFYNLSSTSPEKPLFDASGYEGHY